MLTDAAQPDQQLRDPAEVPQAPPVPTANGPHDLEAQRQWEDYQKTRGIWRYRDSLKREVQRGARKGEKVDRALAGLEPGQRIADDLIVPLAQAIETKQAEAHEAMADPKLKKTPDDTWALLALPAEVLAVVTIMAALSRCEPAQLQGCALDLGGKVMHEVELRLWKAREKAAEKERQEAQADWKANLYELMVKRNDKVDERVFTKWSKKADLFAKGDWSQPTRVRVGMVLLSLLVELDGWFEVAQVKDGVKTKLMFQLTDAARAWVAQRHNQNEMARPFLLPMICEPRDYEYLPTAAPLLDEESGEECASSAADE